MSNVFLFNSSWFVVSSMYIFRKNYSSTVHFSAYNVQIFILTFDISVNIKLFVDLTNKKKGQEKKE